MKIALYDAHGSTSVLECEDIARTDRIFSDYTRLSEVIDVDFPMLAPDAVIAKQLETIDREEQAARVKFQQLLDTFSDRRSKLLALTN